MDYIFSTTMAPHPTTGHVADSTPRSAFASCNSNHAATLEFCDDSLLPASAVLKRSSYHHAEDESEDDIVFPEGENIPPLLKSLPTDDVDQLVAKEMSKLSLGERQKVLYDLHAVMNMDDLRPPSPEIQRSLLQQVRRIIRDELPHSDKEIYEEAMRMDASYVHDDKFVLKFLRNDGWDPKRAAVCLVKHFKVKLELFPSELLCRDITQDDLDPQTLAVLYGDISHDLPLRDMAGRIITFIIPRPGYEVLPKLRRVFYGTMVKAEDEETQLKGRVIVIWLANRTHGMEPVTSWKIGQVIQGLPMKQSAIHVCIPDRQPNFAHASVLALFGHALERLHVVRLKCHFGTPSELKSELQAFGIPSSIIPVSDSGQILSQQANMKWNERRLEERLRRIEPNDGFLPKFVSPPPEAVVQASIGNNRKPCQSDQIGGLVAVQAFRRIPPPVFEQFVQTPSNRDVLLGRGRLCQQHVGNILFRQLIEERQKVFDILQTKGDKTRMAEDIVKHVKAELGGRFLQAKGFGWIEVPDKVARTKVATCFRTMRCSKKKDQEMNG